jgi:hypothetical protein
MIYNLPCISPFFATILPRHFCSTQYLSEFWRYFRRVRIPPTPPIYNRVNPTGFTRFSLFYRRSSHFLTCKNITVSRTILPIKEGFYHAFLSRFATGNTASLSIFQEGCAFFRVKIHHKRDLRAIFSPKTRAWAFQCIHLHGTSSLLFSAYPAAA